MKVFELIKEKLEKVKKMVLIVMDALIYVMRSVKREQ